MLKKILAILVALATVLSLAACGNYEININKVEDETQVEEAENNEEAENDKKEDKDDDSKAEVTKKEQKKDDGKTAKKLSAKKIGTLKEDYYYNYSHGGIYYETDDDMYGIMSLDGKQDTGAKYYYVDDEDLYFTAIEEMPGNTIEDVNCFSLLDANGKSVVPGKYASYEVLNGKFVKVIEITKEVENKSDALLYASESGGISFGPSEGDALYGGNWYVIDITTGEKVPGVSGTKPYNTYAYGDVIRFTPDTGYDKYVNAKGEELPEDADVFDNGTYALSADGKGAVHTAYGEIVFKYDESGFIPDAVTGDYYEYYVAKRWVNSTLTYVLLDEKGKTVSDEFEKMPFVHGSLIHAGEEVYTLDGEKFADGVYSITVDKPSRDYYMLVTDESYIFADREGNIIYTDSKADTEVEASTGYMTFSKKDSDNNYYYYCVKDGEFNIKGSAYANFIICGGEYGDRTVIDALTGKTLLEDYSSYSFTEFAGNGTLAYAKTSDGKTDIYLITAE